MAWWLFRKKGSKNWHVGWRNEDTGKLESKTTRTADRQIAKQRAVQFERDRYEVSTHPTPYRLEDALTALVAEKKRAKRSRATLEITDCKARHLLRIMGEDFNVRDWTRETSHHYLDKRRAEEASDLTISYELGQLRQALYIAHGHTPPLYGRDPKTIWPKAALENAYIPQDTYWTIEQYYVAQDPALAVVSRRDHVAVYCNTGVRFSELYRIEAIHVDLENARVFIEGTKSASTREKKARRWVPLNAIALEVVERRLRLHPIGPLFPDFWSRSRLVQDMKKVGRRARVPAMSANDFRRTFATWCAEADVAESTVIKWMGHTSSTMIRRVYQQLSERRAASEGAKLSAFVGGSPAGSTYPAERVRTDAEHAPKLQ